MPKRQRTLADGALEGERLCGVYDVIDKVGKGGMAWVYQATHAETKVIYALKILFSQVAHDEEFKARFLREARIQRDLEHPNIVSVKEQIADRGLVGFVLEFCNGGNLLEFMRERQGPLTLSQLKTFFVPILDAMGHAHSRGVVHRDLKPQNILLHGRDGKLTPKVTDFGIAKQIGESTLTHTGSMIGTLHYMSPEQVQESKMVDFRADIYSLGVLLYQLSSGMLPFRGKAPALMLQILHDPPPEPWMIDPSLSRVILKAMEKMPEDRYESCEAFKREVEEALEAAGGPNSTVPDPGLMLAKTREDFSAEMMEVQIRLKPTVELDPEADKEADDEDQLALPDPPSSISGEIHVEGPSDRGWLWRGGTLLVLGLGLVLYHFFSPQTTTPSPPKTDGRSAIPKSRKRPTPPVVTPPTTARKKTPPRKVVERGRPRPRPRRLPAPPRFVYRMSHLAQKCAKKDAFSCQAWAQMLVQKQPSEQAKKRAVYALKKACSLALHQACQTLGEWYEKGTHVGKSQETSELFFAMACQRGARQICGRMGRQWESERRYSKARLFFQYGCTLKSGDSCGKLGWLYQNGLGGPQRYKLAGAYYHKGCEWGHGASCNAYGVLHTKGLLGGRDEAAARKLYARACSLGNQESCYNLALSALKGWGGKADLPKAIGLLSKACESKDAESCHVLGVLYYQGKAPQKGPAQALALWTQACHNKHARACYHAALLWARGEAGAPASCAKARPLLKQACSLGGKKLCLSCRSKNFAKQQPKLDNLGMRQSSF